jgi:hypothetical protein
LETMWTDIGKLETKRCLIVLMCLLGGWLLNF